jgi:hypothetical protein
MLFFLVGWPLVAVYHVIPRHGDSSAVVYAAVGTHIIAVVVMQVLGTIRSLHSFQQRKAMRERAPPRPPPADAAAAVAGSGGDSADEDVSLESVVAEMNRFRWTAVGNLVAVATLLFEALQLATFAFQALQAEDDRAPPGSDGGGAGGGGAIDRGFVRAIFIDLARSLRDEVERWYTYFGVAVTAALLALYLRQLLSELRRFALLKRDGQGAAANELWFFSFCGSIIYGHGELRGVPKAAAALAALLSDTLFLVVCSKVLLVLTCTGAPPVLLVNEGVACWAGPHRALAVLAMTSFAVYLPLSAMIAPMLVESEEPPAPDGSQARLVGEGGAPKKDVAFVKPFLSIIVVAKCVLLVAGTFFGKDDPRTVVTATALLMAALFAVTTAWALQPVRASFLHAESARRSRRRGSLVDKISASALGEPAQPPGINIFRALSFLGGVWGAIVALIALEFPDALGGDAKYALLLAGLAVLASAGALWYRAWKRGFVAEVAALLTVRRGEVELGPAQPARDPATSAGFLLRFIAQEGLRAVPL